MGSYGSVLSQGNFTATGNDVMLNIPSDVDFMHVTNMTRLAAGAAATTGVEWYWQRNMPINDGRVYGWLGGAFVPTTCAAQAAGGFTLLNTTTAQPGPAVAIASGTNVVSPVFTAVNTGIAIGTVVRVFTANMTNINGLDFTVGAVGVGTFTMRSALQQAPGTVSGAGTYRIIAPNRFIYDQYYPSRRVICNITRGVPGTAVVTTLVDHGYTSGQEIRLNIPAVCGMQELNGKVVVITQVYVAGVETPNTFTIDIDTTNFTPFVFPLPAAVPFQHAEAVALGGLTGVNSLLSNLDNNGLPYQSQSVIAATRNEGFRGMILSSAGATGILWAPAGTNGDSVFWVAGKSINI